MNIRIACLALLLVITSPAAAFTLTELQALLQASPSKSVSFVEVRESPWLEVPAETRGSMVTKSGVLEKTVVSPRKETWRILSDRLEWESDSGVVKQVLFSQSPAIAPLANALRKGVSGDLRALQHEFRVELRGDRRAWTVRLTPLDAPSGRALDHIELEGHDGTLRLISTVERQGARTTTRLYP